MDKRSNENSKKNPPFRENPENLTSSGSPNKKRINVNPIEMIETSARNTNRANGESEPNGKKVAPEIILRSSIAGRSSEIPRKDKYGINIRKGGRKHKATFADEAEGCPIASVVFVQSFKKYNKDIKGSCCCTIW